MESISSLLKKLAEIRKKRQDLNDSVHKMPEVIKVKKDYDEAMAKVMAPIIKEMDAMRASIIEMETQVYAMKKEKTIVLPPEVIEFINNIRKGCDWGSSAGWKVKWVSPTKRFIIATNPGHTFWLNQMDTQHYANSKHFLFDISLGEKYRNKKHISGIDYVHACQIFDVEGRLSKADINRWQEHAIKEEGK